MIYYKVTQTDTHIFFMSGPYSNWHPTVFHGKLAEDGPVIRFTHGEQYMMAGKALLFGDQDSYRKIMAATTPRDQKALGRAVGGFTKEQWEKHAAPIWDQNAKDIVFRGNWYKAQFNPEYRQALLNDDHRILVEANSQDTIWAVGLAWDDPAILDPANWRGTNWLGETHMEVQRYLRLLLEHRTKNLDVRFDPWTKTFIDHPQAA